MKQSKLFTKTQKFAPKDEQSKNAQLLIRAGFVYKEMAGVYSFLPLGLRVIEKISMIIKKEMDKIGGVQMKNATFQKQETWDKTKRWSDELVDNWFKTQLKNGTDIGLAFTHEEALTKIMTNFISSYKDLPVYAYQFQTKFRNELSHSSLNPKVEYLSIPPVFFFIDTPPIFSCIDLATKHPFSTKLIQFPQ